MAVTSKNAPRAAAVPKTAAKPRKRAPKFVRVRITVETQNPKTGEWTARKGATGTVGLRPVQVRDLVDRLHTAAVGVAGIMVVGPEPQQE